jgi:phosphatidylserine/phosphatidylglycerophosphate/cardiolipin synthase-like enzyme
MKKTMDANAKLYKQRLPYRKGNSPNLLLAQPWFVRMPEDVYFPRHGCSIVPLICGEEVFADIANAVKSAQHTVDIITWGFDPGMVLVRGDSAETGERYGDLLVEIATRKKNPVLVRLLVWHDDIVAQKIMNNAPGYYGHWYPQIGSASGGHYSETHRRYSAEWYEKVINHEFPNIHMHVRHIDPDLLGKSLADEDLPKRTGPIGYAAARYAAHHQKMVLIDYEAPDLAMGYVMGHNSMTEYWDTSKHVFHDPRRETIYDMDHAELMKRAWREGPSFEGAPPGYKPPDYLIAQKERAVQAYIDSHSHITKPYQDVSCRLRGAILFDLNHNFCQGWSESKRPSGTFLDTLWIAPFSLAKATRRVLLREGNRNHHEMDGDFVRRRAKLTPGSFAFQNENHSVQLLRTQPLHAEKGVKECYANLTRQMCNYIFIQNQYLQYAAWAEHLLLCIGKLRQAGYGQPIYVFLLTSTPERPGMDRPTYEVASRIGQSKTMKVEHDEATAEATKNPQKPDPPISAEEMSRYGINVVMGSLWTCATSGGKLLPSEYEEIYIHAKVAIVDDAAFTIGSTNLNLRSMAVDSELNVLSNAAGVAYRLRRELFLQCTGRAGAAEGVDMGKDLMAWKDIMDNNSDATKSGRKLESQLMPFLVDRKPGTPLI